MRDASGLQVTTGTVIRHRKDRCCKNSFRLIKMEVVGSVPVLQNRKFSGETFQKDKRSETVTSARQKQASEVS